MIAIVHNEVFSKNDSKTVVSILSSSKNFHPTFHLSHLAECKGGENEKMLTEVL